MEAVDYKSLVELGESWLRAGNIARVQQAFAKLNTARIPSSFRLDLTRLCRRAGLIATGMRILTPRIHPDKSGLLNPATPQEKAEYAMLLIRTGAAREGLALLNTIEGSQTPESYLFRAFGHFTSWDYAQAVEPLLAYSRQDLPAYSLFIGRVNLAAAYIGTSKHDEAFALLNENIAFARENRHGRLLANCLEMRAQVNIQRKDYVSALADLDAAAAAFGAGQTNDQLFVRKWRAAVEASSAEDPAALEAFRAEALARREWESVRDADFLSLRVRFAQDKFDYLYFGTPFAAYREKITSELKASPSKTEFRLGDGDACLDLNEGHLDGRDLQGRTAHQVIEILLRDFYRPLAVGGLFSELYPHEHFNIFSSPDRVHQALRRTRLWLRAEGLPIRLHSEDGRFRVECAPGASVCLPQLRGGADARTLKLKRLRDAFGGREYFSPQDAMAELEISRASLKRLFSWAVDQGHLHRFGDARATRYHF